jgi:hypothetical protein
MKAFGLTLAVILGVLLVLTLGVGGCTVSALNREVRLRNATVAKSTSNQASLDTMWKTIKSKGNITTAASANIKDMNKVYADLVEGRKGGTLFKMVQESYPNLGVQEITKLYQDLMRSVEAERKTFKTDQLTLQDLLREHRNSQTVWPSSMAINMFGGEDAQRQFKPKGDAKTPENWPDEWQYTWVTSGATKQMVDSGEENDLNLGLKDDQPKKKAAEKE